MMFLDKGRTMDNVKKHNIYINVQSSQNLQLIIMSVWYGSFKVRLTKVHKFNFGFRNCVKNID
jgi:hypothetical protein